MLLQTATSFAEQGSVEFFLWPIVVKPDKAGMETVRKSLLTVKTAGKKTFHFQLKGKCKNRILKFFVEESKQKVESQKRKKCQIEDS